jgi:filamentous hemagglutinin family protein
MNKTFKHVTNTKNGELVSGVAAETARTAGGLGAASVAVGTGPAQASAKATLWGLKAMAWAVLALCGSLSHAAAPVGVVAHGEASLVTQGSVLNVHQSSKAATINFQQLNLGKGEGVAVQARSASDITLLRVAGGMNVNGGFVTANNNLMISSPSGIAVSNGGKVSAQGEVYMTTQNMAVGQYTKPAARASAGAISVTGHSQISGSNIVLDAGSIHLSQATLTATPVRKTDGITLQAATVSVQDSSLNAAGGQISVCLEGGNWTAAAAQSAVRALGTAVGANSTDVSGTTVTDVGFKLALS